MSFRADNNRIHVTDTSGNIVFDTNRKMFAVTDHVVGSTTIANKPPDFLSTGNYQHQVLANINPNADFVMGHCRAVSGPADGGLPNIGVFNAGGSVLWGWAVISRTGASPNEMWANWIFHFVASGGQLLLTEEWFNKYTGVWDSANLTLVGGTISYSLYCGTFV